jgi:hypothetical protein
LAGPQLTADVLAAHFRNHQVENHGSRKFFARDFQTADAVFGLEDDIALFAQMQADQIEDVRFVLDDQNGLLVGFFGRHGWARGRELPRAQELPAPASRSQRESVTKLSLPQLFTEGLSDGNDLPQ